MKRILIILACLELPFCFGQVANDQQKEISSKEYLKVVYEQCANPDIVEIETTPDGYIEVEYFCEGNLFEIGIKNNRLLYSEQSIEQGDIPLELITSKLDKKYQGWIVDEYSKVIANDTSFLKVEILKDGIEQNVYFTNDGKWYRTKPIDLSSTFDVSLLEKNRLYISSKYNFHQPADVYEMPDLLHEISGLALSKDTIVYCVQDEIGAIFEYSLTEQKITNSHRFTDIGDFEDLAIHNNTIYVLRSDGKLFVHDLKDGTKTREFMLQTNSLNIEGMCYNEGYLYIACKEALVTQSEDKRMIFRVSVNDLDKIEPFLEISQTALLDFVKQNYAELALTDFRFNPSAIAFHPLTKELYVLSAADQFITVFKDKKIVNVIPLSPEIYYQPEGLSFYSNGDVLISSEGDNKGFVSGSINRVSYK